jgi:hypothetical protein
MLCESLLLYHLAARRIGLLALSYVPLVRLQTSSPTLHWLYEYPPDDKNWF